MTTKSDSTITQAELCEYRKMAEVQFRKTPPLAKIDYDSPVVAQHLLVANIARTWLEMSKSELRKNLEERVFRDADMPAQEFQAAMIAAQEWFNDNAEMIQSALTRSAVVAAANLTADIDAA